MVDIRNIGERLYRLKVHHIVLWLLYFIACMVIYRGYHTSWATLFITTFIYFVFQATPFYITAYYLLPKYLYRNRYAIFLMLFLAITFLSAVMLFASLLFVFREAAWYAKADKPVVFFSLFISIIFIVGVLCAIKLIIEKVRTARNARQQEQQRIASELQYLKAQMNPHFLFNAINSIYVLIRKDQEKAAETLLKLSDLLRFQLYDCSVDEIQIEKEVAYLQNFIAMEQLRKGEKIKVYFEADDDLRGFYIAPFLLIPFLENAFKYVSGGSSMMNEVRIFLKRSAGNFEAHFYNTTDSPVSNGVGGIGLKNVKRRLELLYPQKHELSIDRKPGYYSVALSIRVA